MPDVLDCLANLSNDEVFTPPEVANKMLDMLPDEVFASTTTTFLDPSTKSRVFFPVTTNRLLHHQIPNYEKTAAEIESIEKDAIQEAVRNDTLKLTDPEYGDKAREMGRQPIASHERSEEFYAFERHLQSELNRILTTQVFGIAITELTAHLTRRSLYCSKDAAGEYSICNGFDKDSAGNIRFIPMKHEWDKGGNCKWCGASRKTLDRPDDLEKHAYELIHRDIEEIKKEYGERMFENLVVCGNPPYQLNDGAGGNGSSATPIYHKFIECAMKLNPRYLTMIIPSRWMTGGKGLDGFRAQMLAETHIKQLHDFASSKECFAGPEIPGGVCYFLYDRDYNGPCKCYRYDCVGSSATTRYLNADGNNAFIRQSELISIKNKVQSKREPSFSLIVSARKPYGLAADTIRDPSKYQLPQMEKDKSENAPLELLGLDEHGKRTTRYLPIDYPLVHKDGLIKYKIFISKANGAIGTIGEVPHTAVIGMPSIGLPGQLCTETFLQIGPFEDLESAKRVLKYMKTKSFRALVSIRKQSQNMNKTTYEFAPLQDFTLSSDINWSLSISEIDRQLYAKYGLSEEEYSGDDIMGYFDINDFVRSGEEALKAGNYWCALSVALTIPSMCSRIEYEDNANFYTLKGDRKLWRDRKCYLAWCENYVMPDPWLRQCLGEKGAEVIYETRCDILHAGVAKIYTDNSELLFSLDSKSISRELINYRILSVFGLCQSIFRAYRIWLTKKNRGSMQYTFVFDLNDRDDALLFNHLCDNDRAIYLQEQFEKEHPKAKLKSEQEGNNG